MSTLCFVAVFMDHTVWQMLRTKAKETESDVLFFFPLLPSLLSFPLSSIPLDPIQSLSFSICIWTRDEAEMEYLKIAQDLDMYGVNYFLIRVRRCCFLVCKWRWDEGAEAIFTVVDECQPDSSRFIFECTLWVCFFLNSWLLLFLPHKLLKNNAITLYGEHSLEETLALIRAFSERPKHL